MTTTSAQAEPVTLTCSGCGTERTLTPGLVCGLPLDEWWESVGHHCADCRTVIAEAPFPPTDEQLRVVALFATGDDVVVQAGAGAGKTSTLQLLANHALRNGRRGWYGAFNKAIVVDTARKMPKSVECSTMHSLAMKAVGFRYRHRLDSSRQRNDEIARILGIEAISIPYGDRTKRLAAGWLAGKAMGAVRRYCRSADPEVAKGHFEYIPAIDPPDERGNRTYENNDYVADYLLPFARKAWEDLCDPDGRLRYNHDCYLKLWSLRDPIIDKDFVLFDEAQDADPVQVAIIENFKAHGTQVVVVGDEQQVIYEWRGAVNALADFEEMGAQVAFLSQSFRFGDAVADEANGLLERLDARLRLRGHKPVDSKVGPHALPDAILTRSNAAAVRVFRSELADGRKAFLVGGTSDIVSFCEAALLLQAGQHTSHPELACFDDWTAVEEYVTNDEQGEDLKLLVDLVNENGAQEIIDLLRQQPAHERDADVVVSTAHKSKGREWDVVKINDDFHPPRDGGDLPDSELRLAYVAITRAKRHLDVEAVPHFRPGWTPGLPNPANVALF